MKWTLALLVLMMVVVAAGVDVQAAPKKKAPAKKGPAKKAPAKKGPAKKGSLENKKPFADDSITMVKCKGDPKYHYRVYLPKGYNAEANKDRRYSMLLVSSPAGNAKLKPAESWVRENQWIGVMLVEAKNGPWKPIIDNFIAAVNDSHVRFRIHPQMTVVTGYSGGARACGKYLTIHKGVNAAIYCGGVPEETGKRKILEACTMGVDDFNFGEMRSLIKSVPAANRMVQIQDTGHNWGQSRTFQRALGWIQKRFYTSFTLDPKTAEQIFKMYQKRYAEAKSPYTKFCVRDFQRRFLSRQKLNKTPEQKARYKTVEEEYNTLKKNEKVILEIRAAAALEAMCPKVFSLLATCPTKAARAKSKHLKAPSPAAKKNALSQIKTAYDAFEKKYSGTKAGGQALADLKMILKSQK